MEVANDMTRDEVLDSLDTLVKFKSRHLDRNQVPVQFLQNRIAVVLPAEFFTPDEQIKLQGKFQYLMTTKKGLHAYLDFSSNWRGLETPLQRGLS